MKAGKFAAVAFAAVLALTGCASSPAETTTPQPETETTTEEATTISETPLQTVAWPETQIETGEYMPDTDADSWFEEIKAAWVKGGDGSISDASKVGYALYALADGEMIDEMIFDASVADYSALRAQGAVDAGVTGASIYKMDGDAQNADNSSFYGSNAAVQSLDGAFLKLTNSQIEAGAEGATGVFAYNGGVVCISDSFVNVSGGGAGGIQVAGGGEIYAYNLIVNSESKAAIRSDRGGGIIMVNKGTYTSNGSNGCPAIYSTADITVSNSELISNHSRAVVIEGKNSVYLNNCTVSGCDESTKEGSVKANVLLYQSTSGDADEGTSVFTMEGGDMTCKSGAMFYCTNTTSVINLKGAAFTNSEDGVFLIVSEGRWGQEGSNGGICVLNAEDQNIEGDILVDSISRLEINMTSSAFSGAVNPDNEEGYVKVVMDGGSSWTLTADSYINEFEGSTDNIETGRFHLYVAGEMVK